MLARNAYGTSLGENSYGGLGQPRKSPKAAQPMPSGTGLPGPEASQQGSGMNMSAYSPGRARPVPPQSQGTPFQAYAPQQQAGPNGGAMTPQGEWWYSQAPQQQAGPNGGAMTPQGERWYSQAPQQPPPFTQSAVGVNGQQFSDPSQAFAQRDALIHRINQSRAPMFAGAGTYLGEGAPPPTWGQKPPMDFNTLMGQANDMVAGGWQNTFMPPSPRPEQAGYNQSAGTRHWTENPANRPILVRGTENPRHQQPQFQEPAIAPVLNAPGFRGSADMGPPDERAIAPLPAPTGPRPATRPAPGSSEWNREREEAYRQQEQDRQTLPRSEYLDRYVAGGSSGQMARESAARQYARQLAQNSDYRRRTPLPQQSADEAARRNAAAQWMSDLAESRRTRQGRVRF